MSKCSRLKTSRLEAKNEIISPEIDSVGRESEGYLI